MKKVKGPSFFRTGLLLHKKRVGEESMKNRGKASGKFSVCFDGFSIRPDYEKNWKKMQAFFKGTMKKT